MKEPTWFPPWSADRYIFEMIGSVTDHDGIQQRVTVNAPVTEQFLMTDDGLDNVRSHLQRQLVAFAKQEFGKIGDIRVEQFSLRDERVPGGIRRVPIDPVSNTSTTC